MDKKKQSQKREIIITITNKAKWFIGVALVLSWYMPFLIAKLARVCG